jgi:glycine/D-amino acid oxidase-like deaminating enzyme
VARVCGGESRRPGDEQRDEDAYRALDEFMRAEFGVASELHWSAHDYIPADGLPYIGRLRRGDERLHVATGFAKWGMTGGTAAAAASPAVSNGPASSTRPAAGAS